MSKSHIYVFSAPNGRVKIGYASNAYERFSMVQSASPLVLSIAYVCECQHPHKIESVVHQAFEPYRSHGEWFDIFPHLAVAAIREAVAAYGGSLVASLNRDVPKATGRKVKHRAQISEIAQ